MTYEELNGMTVLQLRKLAKEHSVVLGAGIDKAGIIEKLLPILSDEQSSASASGDADRLSEPKFQAAWHNADTPRYSARPAYQAPGTAPRPGRIPPLPDSISPASNSMPNRFVRAGLRRVLALQPVPLPLHRLLLTTRNMILPFRHLLCLKNGSVIRRNLPSVPVPSVRFPILLSVLPNPSPRSSPRIPESRHLRLRNSSLQAIMKKAEAFWNCILMATVFSETLTSCHPQKTFMSRWRKSAVSVSVREII